MNAPDRAANRLEPGRLWSLWDMLDHDAEAFCRWSSMIGQMMIALDHGYDPQGALGTTLGQLQREADRLGLSLVVKNLERIKQHVLSGNANAKSVREKVVAAYDLLRDQLSERQFLAVSADDTELFKQTSPLFGPDVQAKFPSVISEIEEAGKCMALDRSTASAFHSIRCLEAGIRALARSLAIPDPTRGADRSWANLLRDIKTEIDLRWPPSTGRMSGDGKLFDEAYGALAGMQNPYRNSTMHLDEKYSPSDARHIFEVVKGFMVRLAARMDERGLPAA